MSMVLGFFLDGMVGTLGFEHDSVIAIVTLTALLWVLCLSSLWADMRRRDA